MKTTALDEIVALHQFFEDWLGGKSPPERSMNESHSAFAEFERTLAPTFSMVTPSGNTLDRVPLVQHLRKASGSRPNLVIAIKNVTALATEGSLALVRYEEWQRDSEDVRGRSSVAVLEPSLLGPRGWIWRFVQETWLPGSELPRSALRTK